MSTALPSLSRAAVLFSLPWCEGLALGLSLQLGAWDARPSLDEGAVQESVCPLGSKVLGRYSVVWLKCESLSAKPSGVSTQASQGRAVICSHFRPPHIPVSSLPIPFCHLWLIIKMRRVGADEAVTGPSLFCSQGTPGESDAWVLLP